MAGVVDDFRGRKVAVVGMGKSNQALSRYLLKRGASLVLFDRKTPEELGPVYDEFSRYEVEWNLGPGYLETLPAFDLIFLAPGMKKSQPQIEKARRNGAFISTEIDLFLQRCKGTVLGVTGSAGKTTTASLTYAILKRSQKDSGLSDVLLGGNIGVPLIEKVDEIPKDAVVVLELSSFQLQLCHRSPHVALVLNIRPNHLDIHENLEEYIDAKKSIFRYQGLDDVCVLNLDDPVTRSFSSQVPGKLDGFTFGPPEKNEFVQMKDAKEVSIWAWVDGEDLYVGRPGAAQIVASRKDFLIPGKHNLLNALGAILLSLEAGAGVKGMREVIRSFKGIEHRIEFVREISGVRFYNDSIATSPDRTMALLEALEGPKVLILGGYDKGLSFDELAREVVAQGCKVVTMGQTAAKIEEAIFKAWQEQGGCTRAEPSVTRAASLEEAVHLAREAASDGYSVVLSPACASFDMFTSYEERGKRFKEIVERMS